MEHLTRLLEDCLVQVRGHTDGSGFFVAPGRVATCAHVAGAVGDQVTVDWQGTALPGVVRSASALGGRGIEPYPDMAVVEVVAPADGHPCVWLDDHRPRMSAKLLVVGHARAYGPDAGQASGWFTHGGAYEDMIRLIGDEVEPGMSGAPVLNAETGGVCAITKAARRQRQAAGGVAVPVRALRRIMKPEPYRRLRAEHDAYHRRNRHWIGLADEIPPGPGMIDRSAERELRAILATLPAAAHEDHLADYRAVAGVLARPPQHPLHDHGDVMTELAGLVPAEDEFPHVLAYAIHRSCGAADPAAAAELSLWARMTARTRRERDQVAARLAAARTGAARTDSPAAEVPRMPSVMVRVRPAGANRRRYRCEMWRYEAADDITPVETDDRDRSVKELRDHLRDRLPGLVRRGARDERHPMIELVLPVELLDEDVEHWPRSPDRGVWPVLGQYNPVVVRELERFEEEDPDLLTAWRERWDAIEGREIGGALAAVPCTERRKPAGLYSWLRIEPALGALMLPDSPKRPALRTVLEASLYSGIPIMVWRRSGCAGSPEAEHQDCPGAHLVEAVTTALAKAGRDDVPNRIMELRNRAHAGEGLDCGHDVVVLWDDPKRRLRPARMMPPTGERYAGG